MSFIRSLNKNRISTCIVKPRAKTPQNLKFYVQENESVMTDNLSTYEYRKQSHINYKFKPLKSIVKNVIQYTIQL